MSDQGEDALDAQAQGQGQTQPVSHLFVVLDFAQVPALDANVSSPRTLWLALGAGQRQPGPRP